MRYIKQWCDMAVSYIRFKPDRPAVRQELLEHMQDKYDSYIEEGLTPSQAEKRTIREMGSERETGLLLRQIHKPYLGWLWRATQWTLVIVLIVAVVNGVKWGKNLRFYEDKYDPFITSYEDEETGTGRAEQVLYLEPNVSTECNGYTMTVTKVGHWKNVGGNEERFLIRLEVFDPRPWAGSTDALYWLSAEDSLGNVYCPYFEHLSQGEWALEPYVDKGITQRTLFTDTWDVCLMNYVSHDADWIELRYDRGGKEFTIRIDLTGGEGS